MSHTWDIKNMSITFGLLLQTDQLLGSGNDPVMHCTMKTDIFQKLAFWKKVSLPKAITPCHLPDNMLWRYEDWHFPAKFGKSRWTTDTPDDRNLNIILLECTMHIAHSSLAEV